MRFCLLSDINKEIDKVVSEIDEVVDRVAQDLLSELITVTPVQTGALKGAWYIEESNDGWIISNNMEYASIIFDGRRIVGGREYGSKKLPAGISPILKKYDLIMQQELAKI